MFDIQHDSPVPIHEQLASQIRAHVAFGALKAGAVLAEYRVFAQDLLTNPQVVARAYADLEGEGVLKSCGTVSDQATTSGGMVVSAGAPAICLERMRNMAAEHLRQAVELGVACGLGDAEIADAVERALAASKVLPLSPDEILKAIKKPTHEPSNRTSQGIQDLSRENRPGFS
jgi:DNA-binding transcriptional regulator YhcF (GntR family)